MGVQSPESSGFAGSLRVSLRYRSYPFPRQEQLCTKTTEGAGNQRFPAGVWGVPRYKNTLGPGGRESKPSP